MSTITAIPDRSAHPAPADTPKAALQSLPALRRSADMRDLRSYRQGHRLTVEHTDTRAVRVAWEDGRIGRFDFGWLRDNCPCSSCRHPASRERVVRPLAVAESPEAASVDVVHEDALSVVWNEADGVLHRSRFDAGWLRAHCYTTETIKAEVESTTGVRAKPRPADWKRLVQSESAFRSWLTDITVTGW